VCHSEKLKSAFVVKNLNPQRNWKGFQMDRISTLIQATTGKERKKIEKLKHMTKLNGKT